MKHIKSKKIFESVDSPSIIEDIKDICLEVEDAGFSIKFEKYRDYDSLCVYEHYYDLYIFRGKFDGEWEKFNYNNVAFRECVDRIKEYLGDRVMEIEVTVKGDWYRLYPVNNKVNLTSDIISGIKFMMSL